jgi:hypothetical protein
MVVNCGKASLAKPQEPAAGETQKNKRVQKAEEKEKVADRKDKKRDRAEDEDRG